MARYGHYWLMLTFFVGALLGVGLMALQWPDPEPAKSARPLATHTYVGCRGHHGVSDAVWNTDRYGMNEGEMPKYIECIDGTIVTVN